MRRVVLFTAAVVALSPSVASANGLETGDWRCGGPGCAIVEHSGVTIIYGPPVQPIIPPPTPIYVVNQGPAFGGPAIEYGPDFVDEFGYPDVPYGYYPYKPLGVHGYRPFGFHGYHPFGKRDHPRRDGMRGHERSGHHAGHKPMAHKPVSAPAPVPARMNGLPRR